MDDLKQIKIMLWELNCKVEALSQQEGYILQNGILVPRKRESFRDWNGNSDWSFGEIPVYKEELDAKLQKQFRDYMYGQVPKEFTGDCYGATRAFKQVERIRERDYEIVKADSGSDIGYKPRKRGL